MDVEWIVPLLLQKLQSLLLDDQATVTGPKLRDQVQRTTDKLRSLQQSLKDARNDQEQMARLLRLVYSAEDATDTFLTRTLLQRRRPNGSYSEMCQYFSSFAYLWSQFPYTMELKKLTAHIQGAASNDTASGSNLQNETTQQQQQQQRRGIVSSSYLDEDKDVVGLENEVRDLVARLIPERGSTQAAATEVISVVGEGGSGKTTLARIVYERVRVKQHFKNRAWVNVSNYGFRARDIMFDMLKQIDEVVAETEEPFLEQDLKSRVSKLLQGHRYIIVLDDVNAPEVWERIKNAFPNTDNGSRILVTTRSGEVAAHASSSLQLGGLNNEESWELFLKKVCIAKDGLNNNSDLMTFKEQIVKLCSGLPLAIILMGGLLSVKESSHGEWSSVIEQANHLGGDIFTLCYQELPSLMKPCFLYMGLFPKAFEVPVRRLFQLWIAEGLVVPSSSGEIAPEDVADMYLEELLNRNMIEVSRWKSDGIPKTCQMTGSLYDVFSSKATDVGFFYIHQKPHYTSKDQPAFAVRRLASFLAINNYPSSDHYIGHLNSYVSLNSRKEGIPAGEIGKFLNKIIVRKDIGLLAVLDLEGVYKPRLPKTLGKLLKLKHLGLRSTALDSLPESVCDIPCLETLDVKYTMITTLPASIWAAKKLRHLYMDWISFDGVPIKPWSDSEPLAKLQTLWGLCISEQSTILNSLNKITCLRKLGLRFNLTSQEAMNTWILQLTNLHTLRLRSVKSSGERGTIRLFGGQNTMAEHQKLLDLYLLGVLPRPIDVKRLPPNVRTLTLSMSQLRKDPMQALGKLHHLSILRLFSDSYLEEEMICHSGGFPQLRVLRLWKLMELKGFTVQKEAMPCLRQLEIRECKRLQRLDGLGHVTTFKELTLTNMSSQFVNSVKETMGRDVFIRINEWKPYPLQA